MDQKRAGNIEKVLTRIQGLNENELSTLEKLLDTMQTDAQTNVAVLDTNSSIKMVLKSIYYQQVLTNNLLKLILS